MVLEKLLSDFAIVLVCMSKQYLSVDNIVRLVTFENWQLFSYYSSSDCCTVVSLWVGRSFKLL